MGVKFASAEDWNILNCGQGELSRVMSCGTLKEVSNPPEPVHEQLNLSLVRHVGYASLLYPYATYCKDAFFFLLY